MLMDYHLLFIAVCIIIFILTILLLFILDDNKQSIIAAAIFSSINLFFCQINWIGFFGVQVIGYGEGEGFQVYTMPDMWGIFAFFFMLYFLNLALIYVAWYKYTRTSWAIEDNKSDLMSF